MVWILHTSSVGVLKSRQLTYTQCHFQFASVSMSPCFLFAYSGLTSKTLHLYIIEGHKNYESISSTSMPTTPYLICMGSHSDRWDRSFWGNVPPPSICLPLVCTKFFFSKNMISVKKRSRHFHASITPKSGFYLQDCSSWLTALYKRWQITSQS